MPGKENKIMNKTELVEVVSSKAEISKAECICAAAGRDRPIERNMIIIRLRMLLAHYTF